MLPSNHSLFQYCDSNIGLFSIAPCKVINFNPFCILYGISPLLRNSWKSDNYMGSNTEKKPWTNLQNSYKNWSKEIKSDNCCYRKVGRAITKWGAIEKSLIIFSLTVCILLLQSCWFRSYNINNRYIKTRGTLRANYSSNFV